MGTEAVVNHRSRERRLLIRLADSHRAEPPNNSFNPMPLRGTG